MSNNYGFSYNNFGATQMNITVLRDSLMSDFDAKIERLQNVHNTQLERVEKQFRARFS